MPGAVSSTAKDSGASDAPVTTADLENLAATLSNDAEREVFLENLRALIEARKAEAGGAAKAEEEGPGLVTRIATAVQAGAARFTEATIALIRFDALETWVDRQISNDEARAFWLNLLIQVALVLAAGLGAFYLVLWVLKERREAFRAVDAVGWRRRLAVLSVRLIVEALPIAAFTGVGIVATSLLHAGSEAERALTGLIIATAIVKSILVLGRFFLTPFQPNLRLFRLTDETAAFLYVWLRRFAYLIVYTVVFLRVSVLPGLPPAVVLGLERVAVFVVTLLAIVFVLQVRRDVSNLIRGEGQQRRSIEIFRSFAARIWHVIAILYIVSTFVVYALALPGGFEFLLRNGLLTVVVLLLMQPVIWVIAYGLRRALSVGGELKESYPTLQGRVDRYLGLARRIAIGFVYTLTAILVLQVWHVDVIGGLDSAFGGHFWEGLATIAIVLLICVVLWEGMNVATEMFFDKTDESGIKIERSARVRTLLPLFRTVMMVLLTAVVILTTLATIGVDVTPLLATAGVIGIAIGFGSQKLVQDVINGLFILFQNTIAVGDVVNAAGHGGLVERISVRTLELRDLEGSVHTIPFSDVTTVVNMTRGFSYALMDIGIAYREDPDEVIEVLRQLAAELEADLEYGQWIIEPLEVLGVDEFADSAVIVKVRIKTRPIRQWTIKREFYRRLKRRFDDLGIEIPFPHQTIYFGVDKAGKAPPAEVRVGRSAELAPPEVEESDLGNEPEPEVTDPDTMEPFAAEHERRSVRRGPGDDRSGEDE